MLLPTRLLHRTKNSNKYDYGHVLVIAGSARMLGASALCSLATMRMGSGLVTAAVPKSLNLTLQKKISSTVMTWPLVENQGAFSSRAFTSIKNNINKYQSLIIGPGVSLNQSTQKLVQRIVGKLNIPMVIDADGLNALVDQRSLLLNTRTPKILTPHSGEMGRLIGKNKIFVENNREKVANDFVKQFKCVLVLKGAKTIIAAPNQKLYINSTGNPGMATAGSGDVLSGIIGSLLGQGYSPFEAATIGVFLHGKAGDIAVKEKSQPSLIATDLIDYLSLALKL